VRALLPLVEEDNPEQVQPVREALSQLQMVYAREIGAGGGPQGGTPGGGDQAPPRESPPQQRDTGRSGLWVPPGSAT
jgi:hypothetical protein